MINDPLSGNRPNTFDGLQFLSGSRVEVDKTMRGSAGIAAVRLHVRRLRGIRFGVRCGIGTLRLLRIRAFLVRGVLRWHRLISSGAARGLHGGRLRQHGHIHRLLDQQCQADAKGDDQQQYHGQGMPNGERQSRLIPGESG